ncbi:MAG: type II toxin-antitoxin system ParD family antitoxin [Pseudomonadota bacterium]
MVTRNIVLTDEQDRMLKGLIASGRYQNVSEAMRAGLRLLEREEADFLAVKRGLEEGLDQAEAGDLSARKPEDAISNAFRSARNAYG